MGNNINLSWNYYYGFWYNTYRIYRGTDPDSMSQIDSLPYTNSTYTDTDPPQGDVYYQVEAKRLIACNPTRGSYSSTLSNFVDNKNISIKNNDFDSDINIYPNPTNGLVYIDFNKYSIYKIELFNSQLKTIIHKNVSNDNYKIDISGYPKGIYFLKVTDSNKSQFFKIIKY